MCFPRQDFDSSDGPLQLSGDELEQWALLYFVISATILKTLLNSVIRAWRRRLAHSSSAESHSDLERGEHLDSHRVRDLGESAFHVPIFIFLMEQPHAKLMRRTRRRSRLSRHYRDHGA
jgi:hypothetical protein